MADPVLQRSVETFRRSGSSGSVWDERFLLEDKNEGIEFEKLKHSHSACTIEQMELSSYSDGGRPHRASTETAPAVEPRASPKPPARRLFGQLGKRSMSTGGRTDLRS